MGRAARRKRDHVDDRRVRPPAQDRPAVLRAAASLGDVEAQAAEAIRQAHRDGRHVEGQPVPVMMFGGPHGVMEFWSDGSLRPLDLDAED